MFINRDTIGALFRVTVALNDEVSSPVNLVNNLSLMHIRVSDVYVCAVTNLNAVPFLIIRPFCL